MKALSNDDIERYSRQLILPSVGVQGQLKLKRARVLVVGAGGLGATAIPYLAAAGVGTLGVLDHDAVERSNLQRQILHSEATVGQQKTKSAGEFVERLNSSTVIRRHDTWINLDNAVEICEQYDVIMDCCDNVTTRYLLSDVCVRLGLPLVSGSALGWQGQLSVYNLGKVGPCYRCLHPEPPPAAAVGSCADDGVIGAVAGTIGSLQAVECIKLLVESGDPLSGRLLIWDALSSSFRVAKLRPRVAKCICSTAPETLPKALSGTFQTQCKVFSASLENDEETADNLGDAHLIDVRNETQFEICHIPNSVNIPLDQLVPESIPESAKRVIFICRRGIDSMQAVQKAREWQEERKVEFKSLKGGLSGYAKLVDSSFPLY